MSNCYNVQARLFVLGGIKDLTKAPHRKIQLLWQFVNSVNTTAETPSDILS